MAERSDIIVIGGGLAGLAAAVALGGAALRRPAGVVLVDAGDPCGAGARPDGRAIALTATSRLMCEALGVWPAIAPHAQPFREIVVTDSRLGDRARPALLYFGEHDRPSGPSAYMVETHHLLRAFAEAALASPEIAILSATRAAGFAFRPGLAEVATADGRQLAAGLIVAADGQDSPTRAAAGIPAHGWSYGQTAIVTTVEHDLSHGGRAEEHFLPAGPFAILPLTGQRSSLVWTESGDDARRLLAMDDEPFLAELRVRFGERLGEVRLAGPRRGYPLGLRLARDMIGPRLALIGDAAHVVHPIAGLGFNLGLRDVAALADCVGEALRLGLDPGSQAVLEDYARWRRFDTMLTALATEGLNRLFSNDSDPVRRFRDAGLGAVERLGPLKALFMRQAAGEMGRLPRLLRGEPV